MVEAIFFLKTHYRDGWASISTVLKNKLVNSKFGNNVLKWHHTKKFELTLKTHVFNVKAVLTAQKLIASMS